ncbi:MerR family transcriptional regulator [Alkalimarinus alittae]|uniref:MerR family transcriptional regulator n=1 Tax=Alkalimarinus alittae TaxID=2961619 RepID=A0ABY6N329_9ALTE|nr:MerR family transcriptional regulator [Alkalimarinus alittae]UZE96407.1 MerR family transcriptional regulator [Alkalimarinus alittae]
MQVSQLAKKADVSPDTVRFYTKEGLLRPQKNPENGYQQYSQDDLQRLVFTRKARQLGFSLKEIQEILSQADDRHSPCPMVRGLFEKHLLQVEKQIDELQSLQQRMLDAMNVWQKMPDGVPDGQTICQLIENWDQCLPDGSEANVATNKKGSSHDKQ